MKQDTPRGTCTTDRSARTGSGAGRGDTRKGQIRASRTSQVTLETPEAARSYSLISGQASSLEPSGLKALIVLDVTFPLPEPKSGPVLKERYSVTVEAGLSARTCQWAS